MAISNALLTNARLLSPSLGKALRSSVVKSIKNGNFWRIVVIACITASLSAEESNQLSPKLANPGYVKRARQIYDRVYSELVNSYAGWYVAIEPDSGDYFLNVNKALAQQQAKQKNPSRLICTFQLIPQEHS
ncbi:MAG: hypothetical protein RMY62_030085 [Nostoc sp. ZfuVER08]|uniref:hypothetical protein n=1 Tax=Nostoc punctiforme TaxID=272131 RepID=UPI0028C3C80C|nr:hypothetical protein [Nostoc punctiforme]MDZ8011721.1 hypothetical protein [Nostoc sp. ZfuVER08]